MGRVNDGSHSFICQWNEPFLQPSHRASLHFNHYSFSIMSRVGGEVGLGSSLNAEVVCPPDMVTCLSLLGKDGPPVWLPR